jgi:protein tyrosine phosphatase (PTP) superfamily phosphohydrolase (DUF442 family)
VAGFALISDFALSVSDIHRMSPRRKLVFALLAVLTITGVTVWSLFFKTYHLATVQPNVLYRDGCQKIGEFTNAVNRVKPRTVVSLIDDRELQDPKKGQFKVEAELLAMKGIALERIPVKLGGWPTRQDVARFLSIVNDKQRQPVLVHCAQGVRRTGMMVAAYQESALGMTDEQAKRSLMTFGHSDRTAEDVKRFIDEYDPKTGNVAAGLQESDE